MYLITLFFTTVVRRVDVPNHALARLPGPH